ncbi:hypothetical protein BDN72DRAFT_733144, partial [Pluteus cervinus]
LRDRPPKCHPDTRHGIRGPLIPWPDDPQAGSVRWISGWMGTGKSAIVQTMAEYWADQDRLAATYFF